MRKKSTPWLIGILLSTLFFAALVAYSPFQYAGCDDLPILRSFMGYEGGVPAHYNLYIHTFFAWLLYGLALLWPGITWFSILQLFLLWLSCVVIIKGMIQYAARQGLPAFFGALLGMAFLCVYAALSVYRISYTITSAVLGAAAVVQLFSVDYRQGTSRQVLRGMLLSIALLLCTYSLRQLSVLPPLAFWLLALLFIALREYGGLNLLSKTKSLLGGSVKPLLKGAVLCAACFGLFAGVRWAEIKILRLEDFLEWQTSRIQVFDYTAFATETDLAALPEVGWSTAEFSLISQWYFMDQNITAEAFNKLYALQPTKTESEKISALFSLLGDFFSNEALAIPSACAVLLAALFCGLWRRRGSEKSPWLRSASAVGLLLATLLLCYLGYQGRLPWRAAVTVLFPGAAFFTMLSILQCGHQKKAARSVFSVLFLAIAVFAMVQCAQVVYTKPSEDLNEVNVTETIPVDLDEYALENPDVLIFYDMSLLWDSRLFPDTSGGIPTNLMFWGGWPARSPSWHHQLSVFGIDGKAFTGRDLLRENVVMARAVYQPMTEMLDYISESSGLDVGWEFHGEYGYLYFFQFYEE